MKKLLLLICVAIVAFGAKGAKVNAEKTITVDGLTRKYVLYVPDNISTPAPLVFSLHGAAGHDTDRSPFHTYVADSEGCIVVYPQGENQFFPVFGGSIPGWNSTGVANEDLAFFRAIIEEVAAGYSIDRNRIYCCGFSNGGMMTYSNSSAASDIFAAFASISGFQLNEFHHRPTGYRPVPFMHIHGKADDFVKYSCMPIIRDNMVARNGCNPVPEVTEVAGKYRKSVYTAGEGGFPYVYYEVDGMGHNDFTDRTPDGNSAYTMWRFMSQYTLDAPCDTTLKWRLNIDTDGFNPREHSWKVNADRTRFTYGTPKKPNNADNNVYPSLQLEAGDYALTFGTTAATGKVYIQIESLDGAETILCKSAPAGTDVVIPISTPKYGEYKVTIVKTDPECLFTSMAIHSCAQPATEVGSQDDVLPEEASQPETGYLIEIPQDQGRQYDNFTRTALTKGDAYNTYTATGDLQIAFKMMNIDVKNCDYVVIRFAEPVKAGWRLAFWEGTDITDVPEGSTEYVFELEQSMLNTGILPQICLMTFFGGYEPPLEAKVTGVYKHCTLNAPDGIADVTAGAVPAAYYTLSGLCNATPTPGLNIVLMSDGTTHKVINP